MFTCITCRGSNKVLEYFLLMPPSHLSDKEYEYCISLER